MEGVVKSAAGPDGEVSSMKAWRTAIFVVLFVFIWILAAGAASPQDIFEAIRKGDVGAVKGLIEKSPALMEARDADGARLLHYAAYANAPDLVRFLIDKGAAVDAPDAQARTPLHIAVMSDRKEAAAALIERGAALEARDDYQRTALILCARERGQAALGRLLIDAGAAVNAKDKFGSDALGLAAWRGKADFVDLLLERGAQVPESGERWGAGLSMAATNGLTSLFRRLSEGKEASSFLAVGPALLRDAAAGGSAAIVEGLIEKGFDPAGADRLGWTPLHYAARDGRTDAARILVAKGVPLDARTIMGQTAYNVALERKMEAVAAFLAEKGADKSDLRFPLLEGDYLGQKPPGNGSEVFGLGIMSSVWGLHSTAIFSHDGNEAYWAPMMTFPGTVYSKGGLLMMRRVDGRWTPPVWAPFSGPDFDDDVPFFSPDGTRLYFISRRPLPGETEAGGEKIWFVDRTASGWSEPRPLDPGVNAIDKHWQFSVDGKGDIYFAGRAAGGLGGTDIYRARAIEGGYERPVNVGAPINAPGIDDTPFIAPDGSYLLFSREFDLWASFRNDAGAWTEPVRLGPEVNSPSIELCPVVTADGKYLFFLSQRDGESHAYWARADIIEKARQALR
jgi:ankyrin repeat protein